MTVEAARLSRGQKAKQTRQRNADAKAVAARVAQRDRRQKVIDRYGSEDAARAPANDRERAIIEAGAEFDRRRAAGEVPEGEYREVDKAWPMPTTYAAALVEQAEWDARAVEFEDLGDSLPHDLEYRADIITILVDWGMPLRTVAEIHDRLKRCYERKERQRAEGRMIDFLDLDCVADAVMRDLGAMVETGREKADSSAEWPSLVEVARNTVEAVSRHQAA